jgi:diaminopimelate decarboxylase
MQMIREPLENRNGELYFAGVSSIELAENFDTPLYVISEKRIRENYRCLFRALSRSNGKIRIYYAVKANSNLSVLKILANEGAYMDVVSPGEVFLVMKAGFPSERILFTGTSVRNDELEFLVNSKVPINIDSLSQLDRLLKLTVPKILSVRVNPEVGAGHHSHVITAGEDSKFGLWESDALRAFEMAKKAGVERFGIQMHVGSGVRDFAPFIQALDRLLDIAKKVHSRLGIQFEFVDMGGGLGVPYKPDEAELDLTILADKVLALFKLRSHEYDLGEPAFCVEPGRYLVSDASVLLTRVNTTKVTPCKRFVGVDAGFNTLVRPTMYGSYHHIVLANKLGLAETETYDVVGPICESGDAFAKDRQLPKIEEGDLLAILNAGAYGFSMSSQYNSRPRAAEVMIKEGEAVLVRKREEFSDLLSHQLLDV